MRRATLVSTHNIGAAAFATLTSPQARDLQRPWHPGADDRAKHRSIAGRRESCRATSIRSS